jgi:hypothetical protein
VLYVINRINAQQAARQDGEGEPHPPELQRFDLMNPPFASSQVFEVALARDWLGKRSLALQSRVQEPRDSPALESQAMRSATSKPFLKARLTNMPPGVAPLTGPAPARKINLVSLFLQRV